MSRQDSGGAVMLGFLLGAVVGAVGALLFAPAPGEETRHYLSDKARESRTRAAEAARHGREYVTRQRETVKAAIDRGRDAYQQARTQPSTEEPA